ncbi:hypothetical protein CspeluHIS016_0206590 [Cutaneotrichosporon spelunceum]|uniref:mRNA stability protein n=1 Tax=Cutaneotrichosporon spelunceum TaxID=1672016 RepID=A0AAD3TRG8_9TREE|nr:hypothetical protein CspeluHIS016_0206590 [Cutaneotrichosporon spelunceum]
MNPHKMNKLDVSSMSADDQKAFRMYGKVPQKSVLSKINKERKYFDSGDYMMSKAGVSPAQPLGTAIPTPEGLPHASPPSNGHISSSPTGQPIPFPLGQSGQEALMNRRASAAVVGVGMQAPNEPMIIPGSHQRRGSESGARTSPPGTLRECMPPSSYPIQHHASFGSSPVKTSALARRVDEDIEI